ncbi:MAG: hypothetical protein AB1714_05935 [Acidobacteriota bacterium]
MLVVSIVGLLSILTRPVTSAETAIDMPDLFLSRLENQVTPLWVSATAATTSNGDVRWDLLGEGCHTTYEILRSQDAKGYTSGRLEDGCVQWGPRFRDRIGVPRDTFNQLVESCTDILKGTIVAIDQGFYRGDPSSLLKVRAESFIKNRTVASDAGFVYICYPYAKFAIGETKFCKADERFEYRPRVGDTVIAFQFDEPLDVDRLLLDPDPESLSFENVEGRSDVPESIKRLLSRPLRGLPELEQELRRLTQQQ